MRSINNEINKCLINLLNIMQLQMELYYMKVGVNKEDLNISLNIMRQWPLRSNNDSISQYVHNNCNNLENVVPF